MKMRTTITALLVLAMVACTQIIPLPTSPTTPTGPITITPPVVNLFAADATRLATATLDTFLRWDVSGDTSTRCRIDSPGQASASIGNVALAGFVQVRPQVSRDYVLTCTNAGGSAQRAVSIIVG